MKYVIVFLIGLITPLIYLSQLEGLKASFLMFKHHDTLMQLPYLMYFLVMLLLLMIIYKKEATK